MARAYEVTYAAIEYLTKIAPRIRYDPDSRTPIKDITGMSERALRILWEEGIIRLYRGNKEKGENPVQIYAILTKKGRKTCSDLVKAFRKKIK